MVPVLPYIQKLARKPLDFSVYIPQPETVQLICQLVHEK